MSLRHVRFGLALGVCAVAAALAPSPPRADDADRLRALAEARAKIAERIADHYRRELTAPPAAEGPVRSRCQTTENLMKWEGHLLEARLEAAPARAARTELLARALGQSRALHQQLVPLAMGPDSGLSQLDLDQVAYRSLELESRLTVEKSGKAQP